MGSNVLSRQFKVGSLLKYAMPSVAMMVFFSMYSIVDGMFISQFVGTNALAGLNIIFPITNLLVALSIMIAYGGNALITKLMGEDQGDKAKHIFTSITIFALALGGIVMLFGLLFTREIAYFLGANEDTIEYAIAYGRTMLYFVPFSVLQMLYQTFFVTAGKPGLGLGLTITSGLINILFDYIFIVPCNLGIAGAAYATCLGQSIPAIVGTIYFICNRKGTLYFKSPKIKLKELGKVCANGSSEMVTNISVAITTMMFNIKMNQLLGADGIAAITIIQYAQFLLTSIFMGYSSGVAPIIGYKYGAKDYKQQQLIFKISMVFISIFSVLVFIISMVFRGPIVSIFANPETSKAVYDLTCDGFLLFGASYLFVGFNIFASAFFTALSNGFVSALLSFMRTLVFLVICLIVLPMIWGVNGVWLAVPVAEFLALIMSIVFLIINGKKYGYSLMKKDQVEIKKNLLSPEDIEKEKELNNKVD